jgi:mRNA interferase RelE/StbE
MKWTILTRKSFLKDLNSLPAGIRGRVESLVFDVLPAARDPFQVGKLEKLKGYEGFYKVRFGSYRLGLQVDSIHREIHLLRVMHRRDIYRHFP